MEFFLCNKCKIIVNRQSSEIQLYRKHCWENFKISDHIYWFWILQIIAFLADKGYLVKPLSNHERRTLGAETIFGNWKSFKNDKKCFLFHLKSSFRSQDIWVFALTFWSCIEKTWLKTLINFKFYDVTAWLTSNCNTHIAQYLEK